MKTTIVLVALITALLIAASGIEPAPRDEEEAIAEMLVDLYKEITKCLNTGGVVVITKAEENGGLIKARFDCRPPGSKT